MDGLLAQPLSCLRQRLSLPCRVQVVARNVRGRSTPASLLTGESNIAGLFFSTPFSFLFFCFFNLYPVFIFLMMPCCKPEKEEDGERLNHQCQERKNKCKREQRNRNRITVLHLKCGKLDDQTSTCRREEEREGGPVKLSNLRYALCVLSLSNLFFSFCMCNAYLCVFSTAGALEVITV